MALLLAMPPVGFLASLFYFHSETPFSEFRLFSDDFFYYLETARNVVDGKGSTFDGITRTNGYHPLWMAVLVAVAHVIAVDGPGFVVFVVAVATLASAFGAVLFHRLLGRLDFSEWLLLPAAALYYFAALRLALTGMEVLLVFAVGPWAALGCLDYARGPSARRAAWLGLSASLLVLARLDALLYAVGLSLVAAWFGWRAVGRLRALTRHAVAFSASGALLPAYLLHNWFDFGHWMPVSGVAKGLREGLGLSTTALATLVTPSSILWIVLPAAAAVVNLAGLVALAAGPRRAWRTPADAVVALLLFAPPLFYLATVLRSDWPLWAWYHYPLVLALPVAASAVAEALVGRWPDRIKRAQHRAPALAGSIAALLLAYLTLWPALRPAREQPFLSLALTVSEFAATHPGRYAMGDRAGFVAFLLPEPLLQTEGVIGDFAMVEAIRNRRHLGEVLREHAVDYYVALDPPRADDGSWRLEEPRLPGPSAPRMRTSTRSAPVARLPAAGVMVAIFRAEDLGSASERN